MDHFYGFQKTNLGIGVHKAAAGKLLMCLWKSKYLESKNNGLVLSSRWMQEF